MLKYPWWPEGEMTDEEKQYRLAHDMPLIDTRGPTIAGICIGSAKHDDWNELEGLRRRVRQLEYKARPIIGLGIGGLDF